MFTIAILDDERLHAVRAKDAIQDYCSKENIDHRIYISTTEGEFKELISEREVDILFLDIELKYTSGIELAGWVNDHFKNVSVVFLTGYLNYATDVYDTEHCYFVLKNELSMRLPQIFTRLIKDKQYENLILHTAGKHIILKQKEILYAERNLRITKIYQESEGMVTVNYSMEELLKYLNPQTFVRCHYSLIINLTLVKQLSRSAVILTNGMELPVSRKYQQEVRKSFGEWAKNF